MLRHLAAMIIAPVMLATSATAQPVAEDAEGFIRELVVDLGAAEGTSAVRTVLEEALATEEIGRFLFAGAPSEKATPEQKARYDALFPTFIAASFADQIGELAEREIVVKDTIGHPRRDDEFIVQSRIRDKMGQYRARIDWRVRAIEGEPRLLDVLVERVSPLIARRQEFSAIAEREGVAAVIAHMETVIARGGAAPDDAAE